MNRSSIVVVALLLSSALAQAAPTVAEAFDQLNREVDLREPAISPDGQRVGWREQLATKDGPSPDHSFLYVVDRADAKHVPVRVTAGVAAARSTAQAYDEQGLTFSPDGSHVAFLSDVERKGQQQLYLAELRTPLALGKLTQLTHVKGHLEQPSFNADGKTLAVLFTENAGADRGPLAPAASRTGQLDEQIPEQRIAVVPTDASAPLRPISPPGLFVYEYDWRPDGQAFVASAAPGSGDDNWWVAALHLFSLDAGSDVVLYRPPLQICQPVFSPDGKQVAFIGGLMSDEGINGGDVFVLSASGGKPTNVTPKLRGSAQSLHWTAGDVLNVGMQIEGDSAFATVSPSTHKLTLQWRGAVDVRQGWFVGLAPSRDGKVSAAILSSFEQPPEVVAGPVGDWHPLTQRNVALKNLGGPAQSITWKSDQFRVQGWLLAPKDASRTGGKLPMVVEIHGGPAHAYRAEWSADAQLFTSQGFYVFRPNPRGSYGQGEDFTRANVKDFGYGDLRDVLRGMDEVVRHAPVDPQRVGITGHSYGGYMAMWAVTQTNRFRASVASAGISNWQSYYGENLIDQWMIPYFGKTVYDDPAVYARSSPLTFIKKARTPTLILQGELDGEVPLPQAQELWHALKTLNVPTQLVVYPGEGHSYRDPAHRRDAEERKVAWFDKYLRAP